MGEGIVLTVNSLYPSVMHDRPLPCGVPTKLIGFLRTMTLCISPRSILTAKLKPHGIPCIQVRRSH